MARPPSRSLPGTLTMDESGRGEQRPVPEPAPNLAADDQEALSRREQLAAVVEDRLDPVMAVLGVGWLGFVLYEQVAPAGQRDTLLLVSNIIWGVFIAEFVIKVAVSGRPVRFLVRRWFSILFLVLPALRVFRVVRGLRALRILPAARVIGSGYRVIGTAGRLLRGRIAFLGAATVIAIVSGGQLLYVFEAGVEGVDGLGDALWWSANLAISATPTYEPETLVGRLIVLTLSAYAVVVFAALAATLGAFFVESRGERASVEAADG